MIMKLSHLKSGMFVLASLLIIIIYQFLHEKSFSTMNDSNY